MRGDPLKRNQNMYCTYHRDKGHTTKHCRVLKDYLEQLVNLWWTLGIKKSGRVLDLVGILSHPHWE